MKNSPTTQCFTIGAALLCATLASHAASLQYLGGNNVDTNWNVDANWTGGSVPTSGDTALLNQNQRTFVEDNVNFGGVLTNQDSGAGSTSVVDVRTGGTLAVSTASNGTISGGDGVINVTGGTMSASGTVTNHGTIQLSSGTLSLLNTATSGFNRALDTASGILNVTGGALTAGAAMTGGNIQFRSTIVISGGSFTAGAGAQAFFADGASLTINGDAGTIGFGFLAQNRTGRAADLNFNFGATGVGTIVTAGWMSLTDATINVDGSGYTGGAGVFDLITSSSFTDGAVFAGQSVTGFTGFNGVVSASGNDLILTLTELPYADELATVAALGTDAGMLAAPVMYADDTTMTSITVSAGEIKAVYFSGLDYLGSPTRVFAYVGIPAGASASSPVPAVVLVHGGGGRAFSAWVQEWNDRGYAAISMSVEGHTDTRISHAMAGPSRDGCYNDTDVEPITDQWMYHAVADTVLANSLMRSLPEVVADEVGLMGISWGGIITSTTIGIDTRFKFAIPTYGCGHLYDARNYYGAQLGNNDVYKQIWDPMVRIANATMPVLWQSWPEDPHFPMDSFAYSYHGVSGPYMVSLKPGMGHGHKFDIAETYDFADSIISSGSPWCEQQSIGLTGSAATVVFTSTKNLINASLVYTTGNDEITSDTTTNLEWIQTILSPPEEGPAGTWMVTATLPAGVTGWFINVEAINVKATGYNNTNLTASSDYQENIALLADALAMEHLLADIQSTDTVNVSYSGPANVEISSITISGESHPGSFSSLTAAPLVLLTPTPDTTPVMIQFDNTVASLTEGQTATATLTITWDELDGSTDQVTLPLSATARTPRSVVYSSTSDWSSETVDSIDDVTINNGATVTLDQNASVGSLTVNDAAGPTTGTLLIDQNFNLTIDGTLALGAGTGAGFVSQSTGTVTTADLAINASGLGDASQYNLSGGELSVSNVISINANEALNQNGGTISGSGTIANNGSFSYDSTANQTLSGVISGTGSVTKDGPARSQLVTTAPILELLRS
jgi:dienelactone hydrolase